MTEHDLRRSLAAAADLAIPPDSWPSLDILSLAAASRGPRRRRAPRLRMAVLAGFAVLALGAAGAAAVVSGTLPVQFNLIEIGRPADKVPAKPATSAETAKQRDEAAQEQKDAAAANRKPRIDDTPMSLADAEAAFGAHVLVAASLTPDGVSFRAASSAVQAKPGADRVPDQVTLKYTVDGAQVLVFEERDDPATPLTVDALDQDGPTIKADGGLGRATIETVDGSQYLVGSSVDGQRVVWVMFKSLSGVAVRMYFGDGIAHDAALALATTLR